MRVEEIFLSAVEKPAAERAAYLAGACGADSRLRASVESLLRSHEEAGSLLEQPLFDYASTADLPATCDRTGTVIGHYKLLEQIGEGGFGMVFMAEQLHPVRRKVALKVLKPGMDTRQVVARFEAERQALALMDHPNIARVFDGGETATGRPFFVMELVRGIPITDFCDQNHLPVRTRLEMFVNVCQAVQHAHQKGIIHRDLKPSNIMVTLHDGTPVVKVIDFGIAKALGQQLTDKTLFTNFAQMVGTPVYMSPEQAEMSGLDMDTRSDIYSLGVLLYELLTGTTPCDKEQLKTAAFDEIRRMIREDEPATPSTRISTLGAAATLVSVNRQSDPKGLSKAVRGDLDWIVMKALEKNRQRRYETASALAADVQRHLHDDPVLACPPSTMYRLRRTVRRYKKAVVAGSVILFALLIGIIGTTWGMIRATVSEAKAIDESTQKEDALKDKEAALADSKEQLFLALVSQAKAARGSGRVGQRFETLRAIQAAAQIRVTPELRTEAIAALVLPDAEVAYEWDGWPEDTFGVSFDATFQRYARLDKQGGLTICRVTDGQEEVLFRLPAHGKPPFSHPWMSPDGQFVLYGHSIVQPTVSSEFRIWKLDGLKSSVFLDELTGLNETALAFDPIGRHLAIGHADGTVSVYDLAKGQRVKRLTVSAPPIHLAYHPDNRELAVACGNDVQLFDTDSWRELPMLRHPKAVVCLAWHPDGVRLATGCNDLKIHIWDTNTATEVMPPWTGHAVEGIHMAFNRAGDRLVSADWNRQTRLWDATTGRMLLTMTGYFGAQFSSDDHLLGVGRNGNKLRLYRLAGGQELRVLRRRTADSLESIAFPVVGANGRTLAACSPDWLSFFDIISGEELASVRLPFRYAASTVFFDPSGGWMTGGPSGLCSWPARPDPAHPEVLRVGPPQQVATGLASPFANEASASADGRVLAVPQGDSTVVLHREQPDRRKILGPQHDVRFSAVSPDGRWVVTCSHWWDGRSKSAWIWDARTGEKVHKLPVEVSTRAKFSPDGRWLMTAVAVDAVALWEVGTWREVRRFGRSNGVAFSPDSRLIAVTDVFSVISLLEIATGREVARLTGPEPLWYAPACFTPDGTRLIATCNGGNALFVWDLRLIRQQLKELGLDWDWPEFSPADPAKKVVGPSKVEVVIGELAGHALTREARSRADIEQSRRALATKPDTAEANNNLAWVYLVAPESLRDAKAALPLAEKAVRLAPGSAQYRNTLGVAYYRSDRFREAVETLRPNLEHQDDKGLAFDLYFLAMSYHRLGETVRAKDYYDWALRWERAQRDLVASDMEELELFRTEAQNVLGLEKK